MRGCLTALILALLAGSAVNPPAHARQRSQPPVTSRDDADSLSRAGLRNGLTLVTEEYVSGPIAALVMRVDFGALDAPDTPLAAELLARRMARRLEPRVRQLGGLFEVRVGPHYTEFATVAAESDVFRAVEAQAALLEPPGDDGQLALDLAVLRARSAAVSPLEEGGRRLAEMVYPSPQGETTDGSPEAASSAVSPVEYTVEVLDRLQRLHYHPANMVLATAGSLRRERVLREVVRSLATDAGRAPTAQAAAAPTAAAGGFQFASEKAPVQQNYVLFGYPIPPEGHADRLAVELLAGLLGQGRGAFLRLPRGSEPSHSPYLVEVDVEETPRGPMLTILTVPTGGIDATEVQVLAALETLAARGIPPAELDRARAQWLLQHLQSLERIDDRARLLARSQALGDYRHRDREPALVEAMTGGRLLEVLRRYLRRDRLSLLEVLTEDADARTFTAQTFLEALDILIPQQRDNENHLLDSLRTDQEAPAFQVPEFKPDFSRTQLRKTAILRGPDIWLKERHLQPVATVGLLFSGGRIQEAASTAGLTEAAFRSLMRGLTRRDDGLRYHRLEKAGVRVETVVENDYFGLRIVALSSQVNDVVERITSWLREPDTAIEAVDLEAARAHILATIRLRQDRSPTALSPPVRRGLYGDHPYGFPPGGSPAALEAFTLEQIQSWANQLLVNVHPYLIVLGDFSGTSFLQGLISQLSDRRYEVRGKFDRPFDFEDDSRGQARSGESVLFGFPGPEAHTYSRHVLELAGRLLGEWSGLLSRQLQSRGVASRLRVSSEAGLNGGLLFVSLECDPAKADEAVKALQEELERLGPATIRQDEFYDGLVAAMTRRHLETEDSAAMLDDIMLAVLAGEDANYRSREDGVLTSLSAGEVASVARRYIVFSP